MSVYICIYTYTVCIDNFQKVLNIWLGVYPKGFVIYVLKLSLFGASFTAVIPPYQTTDRLYSSCYCPPTGITHYCATSPTMSLILDFVAGWVKARKSFKEIQETTETSYSEKLLKKKRFTKLSRPLKERKTLWTRGRTKEGGK